MGLCPPKGPTAALNTGLKPATIRLSAEDPTTGSGDPLVVEYAPGIEPGALHRTASTITARLRRWPPQRKVVGSIPTPDSANKGSGEVLRGAKSHPVNAEVKATRAGGSLPWENGQPTNLRE